ARVRGGERRSGAVRGDTGWRRDLRPDAARRVVGGRRVCVVLLIEADQLLRRALRASFRTWDFDVLEAGSGEDGLTLVANRSPDLVVLDLGLPGIDGLTTLRTLRSFSTVPVLVLTVHGE